MTVRRHAEENFYATPAEVIEAVRWVIGRNPPYVHTTQDVDALLFKTRIRPSWWFLSTEMTIHIQPQPQSTRLIADTKSQFFILGDLPDFYNRYLHDFLREVQVELQRNELQKHGRSI